MELQFKMLTASTKRENVRALNTSTQSGYDEVTGFRIDFQPMELYLHKEHGYWKVIERRTGARAFPVAELSKEAALERVSYTLFHKLAYTCGKDCTPAIGIESANMFIEKYGTVLPGVGKYEESEFTLAMTKEQAIEVMQWFIEKAPDMAGFAENDKTKYRQKIADIENGWPLPA